MSLRHRLKNWRNPHNQTRRPPRAAWPAATATRSARSATAGPRCGFPESGRKLTIGRYCSIADKVEILLGGNHRIDWVTTYPFSALRGPLAGGARRRRIITRPAAT